LIDLIHGVDVISQITDFNPELAACSDGLNNDNAMADAIAQAQAGNGSD
jgi:hypothetical protein